MQKGFERHDQAGLVYYTVPQLDATKVVRHCFTTRLGGVSTGETASLNLGFHKKDTRENVLRNYEILCNAIHTRPDRLVLSNQVHGDCVRLVTQADAGKGVTRESDILGVDAFVTNCRGVAPVIFTADCVPVLLLDPVKKVIGLAHSGWRSTAKQIAKKTVQAMMRLGSDAGDILAAIGPSIGPCHFETDDDVASCFSQQYVRKQGKKYYVDLWSIVASQLCDTGVRDQNITLAQLCTVCHADEFFSNRAHRGKIGLMGAVMELL